MANRDIVGEKDDGIARMGTGFLSFRRHQIDLCHCSLFVVWRRSWFGWFWATTLVVLSHYRRWFCATILSCLDCFINLFCRCCVFSRSKMVLVGGRTAV